MQKKNNITSRIYILLGPDNSSFANFANTPDYHLQKIEHSAKVKEVFPEGGNFLLEYFTNPYIAGYKVPQFYLGSDHKLQHGDRWRAPQKSQTFPPTSKTVCRVAKKLQSLFWWKENCPPNIISQPPPGNKQPLPNDNSHIHITLRAQSFHGASDRQQNE